MVVVKSIPQGLLDDLEYSPETGSLVWASYKKGRKRNLVAGVKLSTGYLVLKYDGVMYYGHRAIWELVNGKIPEGYDIDHINGITDDNRLSNLRLATQLQSTHNTKRKITNTSGYKGVTYKSAKGKYYASLKIGGKQLHLGCFDTAEEASVKYENAASLLRGEYHRNNHNAITQ